MIPDLLKLKLNHTHSDYNSHNTSITSEPPGVPKKEVINFLRKEYEHEGKVTILKSMVSKGLDLFVSSGWDRKLCVWQVEHESPFSLSNKPLVFDMPTVLSDLQCASKKEEDGTVNID